MRAVNAASEAITRAGGWVSGHSLLSDAMAVLQFEVPADVCTRCWRNWPARGLKANVPLESRPARKMSPGA